MNTSNHQKSLSADDLIFALDIGTRSIIGMMATGASNAANALYTSSGTVAAAASTSSAVDVTV